MTLLKAKTGTLYNWKPKYTVHVYVFLNILIQFFIYSLSANDKEIEVCNPLLYSAFCNVFMYNYV